MVADVRAGGQRRRQRHGQLALLGGEVAVARAHGQAIGLADDGHAVQLHRHVQVGDHLLHQRQLLVVLFAEDGVGAIRDVEQLVHHGQRPGEMPGPGGALQLVGQRPRLDRGAEPVGVHLAGVGREDEFAADGLELGHVVVEGARVGLEVLALAELQRVDEDRRDHHGTRQRLRGPHQFEVPLVQGAHGGHEDDGPAGLAHGARDLGDPRDRVVDGDVSGGVAAHFSSENARTPV